jgi:alpha-tubulin suppressor-like RCC1 family protein
VEWTPVRVQETGGPWTVVRPGLNVICGLTAQRRAYCWGSNISGSGGHGLPAGQFTRYLPNAVATAELFVDLQVGANAACALAESGEVWCWGANYLGLLGDTSAVTESPVPFLAPLGALRFRTGPAHDTFGLGSSFACGLTASDEAYCWGGGIHGELGNGSAESSPVAVKVTGDHRFRSIAVGANHACGITAYGAAYCWGWNFRGALGISSVQAGSSQLVPRPLDTP